MFLEKVRGAGGTKAVAVFVQKSMRSCIRTIAMRCAIASKVILDCGSNARIGESDPTEYKLPLAHWNSQRAQSLHEPRTEMACQDLTQYDLRRGGYHIWVFVDCESINTASM